MKMLILTERVWGSELLTTRRPLCNTDLSNILTRAGVYGTNACQAAGWSVRDNARQAPGWSVRDQRSSGRANSEVGAAHPRIRQQLGAWARQHDAPRLQ